MNYQRDKSEKNRGILLLSYGGPSGLEEIEPFLMSITGLPKVPENYMKMVKEKYETIGGTSPFKEITFAQADYLQKKLGDNFTVAVGFRHSGPSIMEAIKKLISFRVNTIIGLCLTPHYSTLSCGEYIRTAKKFLDEFAPEIPAYFIKSWHNNPDYIELISEKIRDSLDELRATKWCLLFTAHSLPLERIPSDDSYVNELHETISLVTKSLKIPVEHYLAFQSRRPGKDRWLEPDVKEEIKKIANMGFKSVIVIPLSFVSDHLETLYDIDIVLKKYASENGLTLVRTPSFNAEEKFINLLKNIIISVIKEKNL